MQLEIHINAENKMKKTLSVYSDEIATIRAGRANPRILDRIVVNYYGSDTPLKQIANVSAPEPRTLLIQPYDATAMRDIEKAILNSDLGLNPSNDGKVIRLSIPQLTEERRKDLVKLLKKITETARVAIRNERRDANDKLKKMEKSNEITEDDLKQAEKVMQELTDKYIEELEKMLKKKEEELLEV